MSFVPTLYIGVGQKGCFFTLRETYLYQGERREVRSFHHFNLATTPDEAMEKAQAAAERFALELRTTRESLAHELAEIQRATAEELEARERASIEREARWAQERAEEEARKLALIESGVFAFGRFAGCKFIEAPRGYLTWLIRSWEEFEPGTLMRATAEAVRRICPELELPNPTPGRYVGEVGKRCDFDVTVIASRGFTRECFSGYGYETVWITTMVDRASGAALVSKTSSFCPEEGEELKIRATVKAHDEYRGAAQTVIQRVKIL